MKKIYIKWVDAQTQDGWDSRESVMETIGSPYICETIGWLIEETETAFIICHTQNSLAVCGSINIPKGMVQSVEFLTPVLDEI